MASSSSSSSFIYDVFISFRGEDTRYNFTSNLLAALSIEKVNTFIDHELIRRDEILPLVLNAIEGSKIAVIIFSKNYAYSRWCLEELVKILECKKLKGQIVIPVYYHVDRSSVRNQTGKFVNAVFRLEEKEMPEKATKWIEALWEVSNLPGFDFVGIRSDAELVDLIVKDILKRLAALSFTSHFEGLVGINSRIEQIKSLLYIGSPDVRIVGIWGIGGIGKTTIAQVLFDLIYDQFDVKFFMENISEKSENGVQLLYLMEQMLSEMLGENKAPDIPQYNKERLPQKKVLIVLDGVNKFTQLKILAGRLHLYGHGSRIIITTRDLHILKKFRVNVIYKVKQLDHKEALEFFCSCAFRQNHGPEEYMKFSENVVDYVEGNPLALKVLGAFFYQRSKQEWESAVHKLEQLHHSDIIDKLKISYDELDEEEKNLFLDIACFFKGENRDHVTAILDDYYSVHIGLNVLVDKSLIIISPDNKLQMHGLVQKMGREIVRQESVEQPGKRSRLWYHRDIYHVLKTNMGTALVEGLFLDMSKIKDLHLTSDAFAMMSNLRLLKFYVPTSFDNPNMNCNVHLPKGLDYLSKELRYLHWHGYPLKTLPSNFSPENLIELSLPYSKVEQLWEGKKEAFKLKCIDLGYSQNLTKLPNPLETPKLEKIILLNCSNLICIPPAIENYGLEIIADESLTTISTNKKLQRHDLLQEIDQETVLHEFDKEPNKHCWLGYEENACQLMKKRKEIDSTEGKFLDMSNIRDIHKLEHASVLRADKLVSLFDAVSKRLDSHVSTFWNNKDLEQLLLKLAEVHYLLGDAERCGSDQNLILNHCFTDLRGLAYDVDKLIDDWEQSEISKSKFDQELRRIHGRAVQLLNLLHKLVAGHDEQRSAFSEMSSRRSDEYSVFERDLERSINNIKYLLPLNVDMVRIIPIVDMGGIGKTILNQRIYTDEKVKSIFPFRFWFSVGKNLDLSKVLKAVTIQFSEIVIAEKMMDYKDALCERLLIVLDDLCDVDDEKLKNSRQLILNTLHAGSCVLVTTPSRHAATLMSSFPAEHLTCLSEWDSQAHFKSELASPLGAAHNPLLEREENLRLMAPDMLAIHESEIQLTPLDSGELAASFQDEDESQIIPVLSACVGQSLECATPMAAAKLGTSSTTAAKSIERNVQKIFRYVNDVTASKIGVHGVGGIGKTSLLKALSSDPKIQSMFQVIIFVTVSRSWDKKRIQNEVLRQLSLSREDYETDSRVRDKILQDLNRKRFLLLLDDVWEQIDLEPVGIPVPSSENRCKMVIASRKLDVFHNMEVSRVIELEALSRKEAWELFYKQVGRTIHLPDIQPYARAIVKGCRGLPLLIIVTGRALFEEYSISVWEHASRRFSIANTARVYHTEDVMQLLKFSFDQLKDHDIKSCLLHCGLFPDDREVNILELVEYCFQEGIITGTWADAHKRGHDIVDVLVHASLLQVTKGGTSIKMHGLIKDFALGILSAAAEDSQFLLRAEGGQFLLRAYSSSTEPSNTGSSLSCSSLESPEAHLFLLGSGAGLTEPPLEEAWRQAKMIFLMDNELCTLPERISCHNLLILSLQRNCQLRVIPPSFFDSMTSLKMLNLSKARIKSLPDAIIKLENLQILILRDCKLLVTLPSEVGYLKSLQVLDLRGTEINNLPDEIGKLAYLTYLEVFFYGSINKSECIKLPHNLISSGTLSGLHALETLSVVVYPGDKRWSKNVESVITDVSKLTKLSSLQFPFPEVKHVGKFLEESAAWKDQLLTKFNFVVGHDVKSITSLVPDYVEFDYNQQDKCLRFVNGEKISLEVLQILARSTAFHLDHYLDIDSLSDFGDSLSDFVVNNINGLKFCIISECPRITIVFDVKELTNAVFPSLENLSIYYLPNLTCIFNGIFPEGSFAGLRSLTVHVCLKVEYVFPSSVIQLLTKLEELAVEDCPAIKSIIREDEIIDSSCITSLKKLRLHYLPELVDIWRNAWPSLEYISIYECPELKMLGMASKLKDSLIEIKAEKDWWDALDWEDTDLRCHLGDRLTIIGEDDI